MTDSTGITTYHYDAEGRIYQLDTPQGVINYEYDSITGQKTRTESPNTDTNFFYDEMGRLAEVSTAEESAIYKYDEAGNRDYMELDLDGYAGYEIKTDYTYDQMSRLTNLIQQKTGAVQLASYNYSTNANGMRHSLNESLHEDRDITYGYDNLNRLITETADSNGDGYTSTYEYDLAGNRTAREVVVNSQILTTDYVYDPNTDRLIKETHTGPVYSFVQGNEQYYAYANAFGGYYYRDSYGKRIGPVNAFFTGLPSVWNRYVLILAMALVPLLLFGPAVLSFLRKQESRLLRLWIPHQVRNDNVSRRLKLRVPRKGICLLVAFVMLLGPEHFGHLAQAQVEYANLNTATWANGEQDIHYAYDDNGSLTEKITADKGEQYPQTNFQEKETKHYNLAGRLDKVTIEQENGDQHIVEYTYNDEGIRVESYSYDIPYGGGAQNHKTVVYLVDSYNHTGYAQTLEELTFNKANPDPLTETPDSLTTYLIGDDVIAQTKDGATQYLLYDGHGSTRQLAEYDTDVTIADSYSYDGYGVLLQEGSVAQDNPGKVAQQATNLLYAGEQFDVDAQMYYLRARYYNPLTGLFNRMDDYAGNRQDPQSLHKYLYCHANPVNNVDLSGLQTYAQQLTVGMVIANLISIAMPYIITGVLALAAVVTMHLVNELIGDYIAAGMSTVAATIISNQNAVRKAIDDAIDAARETGRALKELLKLEKFVFFRKFFPTIFDFNIKCLSSNPTWFVLNYLADPIKARANRRIVNANYGHLRRPGRMSIDEFPYASTAQGGLYAIGEAVPIWENWVQGGYLGAFYRWILKATPQPFLVVPVPI